MRITRNEAKSLLHDVVRDAISLQEYVLVDVLDADFEVIESENMAVMGDIRYDCYVPSKYLDNRCASMYVGSLEFSRNGMLEMFG